MRVFTIQSLLLGIALSFALVVPAAAKQHPYRSAPIEHSYVASVPWNDRLPRKVDFGRDMPKPGDQRSQGSCVGWAIAYYKSFQEHRERGWDYSDDTIFSPSYIYNQYASSKEGGMNIEDGFAVLDKQGIAPMSAFPYNESDWKTKPPQQVQDIAASYKAASHKQVPSSGNALVTALREHLASGDAAVVGIPLYFPEVRIPFTNWQIWMESKTPTVIDIPSAAILQEKVYWHAITLVGYDDDKMRFKFINSWGEDWGERGFGYLTYGFVTEFPVAAFTMEDIIAPESAAKYNARLTRRPDIPVLQPGQAAKIVVGLQNTSNMPWPADGRVKIERISGEELGMRSPRRFDQPIAMGSTLVFTMTVSAPSKPGVYDSIWQMTSNDGPFGDLIPFSLVVVPQGSSIGLQEMIQRMIEEERQKWQAEFERRWAELQRRIMERIEEEIRREVQRRFDLLCGAAPAGLVIASGLVWRRRRRL